MATLREVAEYAKVSQAVVSRVLNNKPGVWASEETKKRILEAARVLRYEPSASAKALSTGRSMQLAISTADVSLQEGRPPHLWQLLGFTDAAGIHGYRVVLMASPTTTPRIDDFENLVRSNACDGFCLYAEQLSAEIQALLEHAGVPYVVVGDPGDDRVPQVDVDNRQYAYDSVKWLAEQGHQRIAFAEFADPANGVDRPHLRRLRAGYFSAMHEYCNGFDPQWAPTTRTSSFDERVDFLKRTREITALILPGYLDIVNWEEAMDEVGLRCPQDITLLCHVPTMEVCYLKPGVAYHAHDLRQMGAVAGELLISSVEKGKGEPKRVLIPTVLPEWHVPRSKRTAKSSS